MNKKPPPSLMRHSAVDDFIEHHGVKGMKWGVRNKRTLVKTSSEHKKVSELKKKRTHQLTNRQLKLANERMNLEQNFNRLNPDKVAKGRKHAKAVLAGLGTGVALYNMANSPAGKAAIEAGKKAIQKKT